MRVVIAPDKFKLSLTASKAAEWIARGVRLACPAATIDVCPIADGGDGTLEAMLRACGGKRITRRVTGPLPSMRVRAAFGVLGDGRTAIVEMAEASGLHLLAPEQRNPLRTTSYGTGELLVHAAKLGVRRIILGIGGSATNDGGVGCAQACGAVELRWKVLRRHEERRDCPDDGLCLRPFVGGDLSALESVHVLADHPLRGVEMIVLCDVANPLTGPRGAARVFGPQKGANPEDMALLDGGLARLARLLGAERLARTPGAGAAGGMGFGMMAFFGACLRRGAEAVLEAANLRRRLKGADLCITGEGRFDGQSLSGKAPAAVARLCAEAGVPCVVLAGSVEPSAALHCAGVSAAFSICRGPMTLEEAMRLAGPMVRDAAQAVVRLFLARGPQTGR